MATGSVFRVTEEQEFSQTNNKDPVTAGLTHPLIADKQRQKHFINHRRTKQLRRAKYVLDSTESEQQPFSYSFVDNSNAWTPEREREGEKTKTGKRQTRSTKKKNTHTQQTQTLKPQGARLTESRCLQLPSPTFAARRPSGALGLQSKCLAGWLLLWVAGWREAMCHQELMAAKLIRGNVTGKYRRGKMFSPSRTQRGGGGGAGRKVGHP